ncbi:MFS transporter [Streptomyces sioyaensis]|uniref:MFS transporter n=1 Tax=Streptomyces sioyaensis TaxID=67364 RepID=UPI0037CE930D
MDAILRRAGRWGGVDEEKGDRVTSRIAAVTTRTAPVGRSEGKDTTSSRQQTGMPAVSHGVGFWFAAVAFAVLMAFGTAPTPLWPLYEQRDGFGATTVTVAFAVLVVGTSVGFVALGHLSDRFGRRRVVVPALGVGIAAALVLVFWTGLPGLLTGRLLNGLAIGLMASTATTYLHDLHRQAHPGRPGSRLPGVVATMANLGGLAMGPLIAGAVAQWAPHPLTVTQAGFALAMVVCLGMALSTPETVDRTERDQGRPARFALRPGTGALFGSAVGLGFFSFALLGLVSSLGATMLRVSFGVSSHFVAGAAPFAMFAASAMAQLVVGGLRVEVMTALGTVVFPLGLGLVALSLHEMALWLFLLAVSLAGAGAGMLFKSGFEGAANSAVDSSRAGVLAMYFVAGYLGMGLPAILFSIVIVHGVPVETATIGFSAVLSVGAVTAAVLGRRAGIRLSAASVV